MKFMGFENDFILIITFVVAVGLFLGLLSMIITYTKTHPEYDVSISLAYNGQFVYRCLTIVYFLLSLFLAFNWTDNIPYGRFFTINVLSIGWWAVIRIFIAAVQSLLAFAFCHHYVIRWMALILSPFSPILDVASEVGLAFKYNCINTGVCYEDQYADLSLRIGRDLLSCILSSTILAIIICLCAMFGLLAEECVLSRSEHREMSTYMKSVRPLLAATSMKST